MKKCNFIVTIGLLLCIILLGNTTIYADKKPLSNQWNSFIEGTDDGWYKGATGKSIINSDSWIVNLNWLGYGGIKTAQIYKGFNLRTGLYEFSCDLTSSQDKWIYICLTSSMSDNEIFGEWINLKQHKKYTYKHIFQNYNPSIYKLNVYMGGVFDSTYNDGNVQTVSIHGNKFSFINLQEIPKIKKVKRTKTTAKIFVNKIKAGKKYRITYALSKKFKKSKTKVFKKGEFTIKKLKPKKKYYCKVQSGFIENGKVRYGAWSKIKVIK